VDVGIIEKSGAWLNYGECKWQGKNKAKLALLEDTNLQTELENKIRRTISGEVVQEEAKNEGGKDGKSNSQKRSANA
jgi:hypothetical protein